MTHWELYAVIITILGIAGCSANSSSNQAGSVSSQASETSSRADKFFPDPKVAALAVALERNDWVGAQNALRAGADVNAIGKEDIYPLAWTMYLENKAAFEWLLNHGADPNFDSGHDTSVLFWAAKANDPDWLCMLLAHKANPNLTRKSSIETTETPLLAAICPPNVINMKMLIAAGADINYQRPVQDGGGTPAIDAAGIGFFEGVYILLEAGADIQRRTTGGDDLTYIVASYPIDPRDARYPWREKVLQLLRERGADVDGAFKKARDAEAQDPRYK